MEGKGQKEQKENFRMRVLDCGKVDGEIFKDALRMNKMAQMIEYDPSSGIEENLIYGDVFFLEKIVKIIHVSNNNSDFLPILGVNFYNYKKDLLFLKKILTAKPQIQVCKIISDINQQDKCGKQTISFLEQLKSKIVNILSKNKSILDYFHQQSYQFYLVKRQNGFQIKLGFTNFFFTHSKSQLGIQIVESIDNLIEKHRRKVQSLNSQQKQGRSYFQCPKETFVSLQAISSKVQYQLYEFFCIYTEQIFDFIDIALHSGVTELIYKKSIINSPFNRQKCISSIDPLTKQIYSQQIYHNPLCWHLQGITKSIYFSTKQCPICGNILNYSQSQLQTQCRNLFQMMLIYNSINKKQSNINYFFHDKVFTLRNKGQVNYKDQFNDFFHYKVYTQRINPSMKRQKISFLNQYQTIPLFNRLSSKKKYYEMSSIIDCPVRGRYCRHWQFYDLRRVYKAMLKSQDQYFECFVCCKEIKLDEIIYLNEAKQLLQLIKLIITERSNEVLLNISIKVNHNDRSIKVNISGEDNSIQQFQLDIYCTFENPMMRSRGDSSFFEEKGIEPSQSFISTFYGF